MNLILEELAGAHGARIGLATLDSAIANLDRSLTTSST